MKVNAVKSIVTCASVTATAILGMMPSDAMADSIVIPNNKEMVEGIPSCTPFFTTRNVRYQQVYDKKEIDELIEPMVIAGIAFRSSSVNFWTPDGFFQQGAFGPLTIPEIEIRLSTTQKAPYGLSPTFADNVGQDETIVYRQGPLTLSSAGTHASERIFQFDIVINFTTPFDYNPEEGNLLLEVRNFIPHPYAVRFFDSFNSPEISARDARAGALSDGVTSALASNDEEGGGLITKFLLQPGSHFSGVDGDPHITTWSHEHFDFQGECDLVFVDNPSFNDGTGMHIHGRTKLHGSWSAISSAAIKIGDDILEIHGGDQPLINGLEVSIPKMKDGSEYAFLVSIGGYSLTVQCLGPHSRHFVIHLGNGERIFINNFKEFVDVEIESPRAAEFAGSNGLMGSWNKGTKLGRDGETIIDDADAFGQEWQVHDNDPQLFHIVEGPQYPAKCNMPVKLTADQRHLRAMAKKVSEGDAKKACMKASRSRVENCIADVFGSDNLDMAGIYTNGH